MLIDFDHYIFYVQRCRKFDLRGMFHYHDLLFKNRDKLPYAGMCLFHTVDFFVLVWLASFYYKPLLFLLYGLVFHLALDMLFLAKHDYFFGRSFFVLEHLIRAKRHKKHGYPYRFSGGCDGEELDSGTG